MNGGDKAEIRRQMRRLRRDLSEEEQQRAADGVYAQVIRMDCYRTARTVMAYAAVRGELSMPGESWRIYGLPDGCLRFLDAEKAAIWTPSS